MLMQAGSDEELTVPFPQYNTADVKSGFRRVGHDPPVRLT
jgi:hypothetical protein